MRSPLPTLGRNRKIENIWRIISNYARTVISGSQRPLSQSSYAYTDPDVTSSQRRYDLEIEEFPVRDMRGKARYLIEMAEYSPEAATCIDIYKKNCLLSDDGDDSGFTIADTLEDGSPINPNIYKILMDLKYNILWDQSLEVAVDRFLAYGDAFAAIGTDKSATGINRLLFLPTWEVFRVENNKGELLGFQQRRHLSDQNAIDFHPLQIVHWRFRQKSLYGRGLFNEAIPDWLKLKDAIDDLSMAVRAIGINPTLHVMPDCVNGTSSYLEEYKRQYEQKKREGIVTDFYLANGADLRKLSTINPDFKGIIDSIQLYRSRLCMQAQIPPWMLGLPSVGAREIAGQPALFFARNMGYVRVCFSTGLRRLFDLELSLKGYRKEEWQYRIIYPKIYVDPLERQADPVKGGESNQLGIEDLDGRRLSGIFN